MRDNFFRWWRKEGFKAAWKKWQYNFAMTQTPEQNLQQQCYGFYGTLVGMGCATIIFSYKGMWYVGLACAGGWYLSLQQFRTVRKQLIMLRELKEQFEQGGEK